MNVRDKVIKSDKGRDWRGIVVDVKPDSALIHWTMIGGGKRRVRIAQLMWCDWVSISDPAISRRAR